MCAAAFETFERPDGRHLGGQGAKVNAGGAVPSPARNAWEKVPDRADEGRRACAAEDHRRPIADFAAAPSGLRLLRGRREPGYVDILRLPLGLRQVVGHLHAQPDFG